MRYLEPKSAVSYAPIGKPNMHPRKYTINTSCFWETLYKMPDSKRRLVNMVNINRIGKICSNHSITPIRQLSDTNCGFDI